MGGCCSAKASTSRGAPPEQQDVDRSPTYRVTERPSQAEGEAEEDPNYTTSDVDRYATAQENSGTETDGALGYDDPVGISSSRGHGSHQNKSRTTRTTRASASAAVAPHSPGGGNNVRKSGINVVANLTPAWIRGGGGRARDENLSVIIPGDDDRANRSGRATTTSGSVYAPGPSAGTGGEDDNVPAPPPRRLHSPDDAIGSTSPSARDRAYERGRGVFGAGEKKKKPFGAASGPSNMLLPRSGDSSAKSKTSSRKSSNAAQFLPNSTGGPSKPPILPSTVLGTTSTGGGATGNTSFKKQLGGGPGAGSGRSEMDDDIAFAGSGGPQSTRTRGGTKLQVPFYNEQNKMRSRSNVESPASRRNKRSSTATPNLNMLSPRSKSAAASATPKASARNRAGGGAAPPAGIANELDQSQEVTRQMFDKNTLRLMPQWAPLFADCLDKIGKDGVAKYLQESHGIKSLADPAMVVSSSGTSTTGGASASTSSSSSATQVRIFCRKRPLFEKEEEAGAYDCVHVASSSTSKQINPTSTTTSSSSSPSTAPPPSYVLASACNFEADLKTPFIQQHGFAFDCAFDETMGNEEIFLHMRDREKFFSADKFNVPGSITTLFMLGQTGSGKTFTMTAIEAFAATEIFKAKTNCKVSFVELRGNKVFDLLYKGRSATEVQIREVSTGKYVVQDAEIRECTTALELQNWMKTGHDRRHTEATGANDTSSRSHAVITISMGNDCRLILVDAAGTERSKDQMSHTRERQEETAEINASLYALKECIRHQGGDIPAHLFRQSTLTKLLAESFRKPPTPPKPVINRLPGTSPKTALAMASRASQLGGPAPVDQLLSTTSQEVEGTGFSFADGSSSGGPTRLIGVIVTISPNVTDIEHSLTTLRAGYGMKNSKQQCTHSVKLTDLKKFIGEKDIRYVPVNKWTPDQVALWVTSLQPPAPDGKSELPKKLPGGTTGAMMLRFQANRFHQVFGDKLGEKVYTQLRKEVETPTAFIYDDD
ncbi:unnamed protein product [Amoebophrya sp. A120]|nr:unnamed protein product [Amoebophrya sp. A120]|eukprot:GSA120T00018210001.1